MAKKKDPDIITMNSDTPGMLGDYKPPAYDGTLESMVQLIREPGEKSGSTRTRVVELLRGEEDMAKLVETFDVMRKRADGNTANLDRIAELGVAEIALDDYCKLGLASNRKAPIKILGSGELKKAVTIHAHKFSKSAAEKIAKAGGKAVVVGGEDPVAAKGKLAPKASR